MVTHMKKDIIRLGDHLPSSSRRVLKYLGQTEHKTKIGTVRALADGVVEIASAARSIELSVDEAFALARALNHAAFGVREWSKKASGYYRIRADQDESGAIFVTLHHRRRPMRLSKLRGSVVEARVALVSDGQGGFLYERKPVETRYRRCDRCTEPSKLLYVAADDLRDGGLRVPHCDVCPSCIAQLLAEPREIAEVKALRVEGQRT